jgi:hypothetical protein
MQDGTVHLEDQKCSNVPRGLSVRRVPMKQRNALLARTVLQGRREI